MKILGKMQRRATIWILGAFRTLPTNGLKAITGLIPIKFHLQKLTSRSQLCSAALLENYLIRTLMDDPLNMYNKPSFPSLSIHSLSVRKTPSKDISSTQIINCLEFSLHFPSQSGI